MEENVPRENPIGPLVGSVIILIILILGGLYFWADKLNRDEKIRTEQERIRKEQALEEKKNHDDLNSIEADIKKTDVNKLQSQAQSLN
jgi:hypothetical protein